MEFARERGRVCVRRGSRNGTRRGRGYICWDGGFLEQVAFDPGSQGWVRLEEMEVGGEDY